MKRAMVLILSSAIIFSSPRLLSATHVHDSLDEHIMRKYAYSNWCGRTRMVYPRLVRDWILPDLSLPTNGMEIAVECRSSGSGRGFYIFRNDTDMFHVHTCVYDDVEDTHHAIIERFSNMAIPADFLQTTNGIGDVFFSRRSEGRDDSVVFSRNNVFSRIRSFDSSYSATNIAKQIDASILRASGVNP